MRALVWSIRLLVFLLLFAFAVKNTDPVTLRFYLGATWQAPLIVVLLVFFVAGVLAGVLAMASPLLRQWQSRRKLEQEMSDDAARRVVQPPPAES